MRGLVILYIELPSYLLFPSMQYTRQRHFEVTEQLVQRSRNIPYSLYEIIQLDGTTSIMKTADFRDIILQLI
jgi:hypothetical protein